MKEAEINLLTVAEVKKEKGEKILIDLSSIKSLTFTYVREYSD